MAVSDRPPTHLRLTRREALVLGASASALAAAGAVAGPVPPALAAPSPRLPGEIGRQNNLVSRYEGGVFDHIRVTIGGDDARLFIPQGIVPGRHEQRDDRRMLARGGIRR